MSRPPARKALRLRQGAKRIDDKRKFQDRFRTTGIPGSAGELQHKVIRSQAYDPLENDHHFSGNITAGVPNFFAVDPAKAQFILSRTEGGSSDTILLFPLYPDPYCRLSSC
jgi:hypothetical protein